MSKLTTSQKLLTFLFLGIIFLYCFNQLKESDAFYHLKTGQLIWEQKSIPHADIFSYSAYGAPWVTHEWLAEVIFYLVHKLSGFWGLIGFVAFIALLTYYAVFRLALKIGANFYLAILFLFFFGYSTFKFWFPRPHIFVYLLFAILIFLLENYRRQPKTRYLWLIALDIWFWANINASVILGLSILIFYLIGKSLTGDDKKGVINLGFTTGAAILLSFINPNTYKIFVYSIYIQPTIRTLKISEWQSIISFWRQTEIFVFLVQMVLADVFLAWYFFLRKKSNDLIAGGLIIGISILPFISLRHYAFWPLIAIAPLALAASDILKRTINRISSRQSAIILSLLGLILLGTRAVTFPRSPLNKSLLPVQAADFIETNHLQGPFFNLYNEGGYLIWRFWPKERVFIDGRSEVYTQKQIEEIFTIVGNLQDWDKLINEKYHINYFILAYSPEPLTKSIRPLVLRLMEDDWPLIYWDDAVIIFVRNCPKTQTLIEKYQFRYISPFKNPSTIPAIEAKSAAQEIRTLLKRSPQSLVAQDYARLFLSSH